MKENKIKAIIGASGMTIYAASKKTGVPLSTLYDWVNGRRNPSDMTVAGFRQSLEGK